MRSVRRPTAYLPTYLATTLLLLSHALPAAAESDEDVNPWSHETKLSFVATSGNAESTTVGFEHGSELQKGENSFHFKASGVRSEAATGDRLAIVTPDGFDIVDPSESELEAEHFQVQARFERRFSEHRFWFTSLTWRKNEFAGIANRFSANAGIGHTWWKNDDGYLKTSYSLSANNQEDVVRGETSESFLGAEAHLDFRRQLTETTDYRAVLTVDENLDETNDLRAELIQALGVKINERLSLELSFEFLFDNQPSFEELELRTPDGLILEDVVLAEVEELDSILKVALVVDF